MKARTQLSREAWVAEALRALSEKGAASVAVEALANRLGVTKGSFYWHFRDLAELHEAMRAEWRERSTEYFIQRVTEAGGDARARLLNLLAMTSKKPSRLERAMRAWAVADRATAAHVAGIDKRRMDFVADLFRQYGHDAETAEAYARLVSSFVTGQMMSDLSGDPRFNDIIAAAVLRPRA